MLDVRYSAKFKKDLKLCAKRQYKLSLLQQVIDTLRLPAALPIKNSDHNLSGDLNKFRECHVEPDWLLIYRQEGNELFLYRTGTHADLFGM